MKKFSGLLFFRFFLYFCIDFCLLSVCRPSHPLVDLVGCDSCRRVLSCWRVRERVGEVISFVIWNGMRKLDWILCSPAEAVRSSRGGGGGGSHACRPFSGDFVEKDPIIPGTHFFFLPPLSRQSPVCPVCMHTHTIHPSIEMDGTFFYVCTYISHPAAMHLT